MLSGPDGDTVWDDPTGRTFVPAPDRGVGLLFQDHRLFPHLTVLDNVAFGVRAQGLRRRAARSAAAEWLPRVGLAELADRRPGTLSGGQSQRVALARALAASPRLLLLDEPLAALDARTRLDIRAELRRHLSEFDGPTLLVTHDPLEALVLADRIVVLEAGRVVQEGSPSTVARRPATEYVARLMGLNLYTGVLADPTTHRIDLDSGGALYAVGHETSTDVPSSEAAPGTSAPEHPRMLVVLAPSAISIHTSEPVHASTRNIWPAVITWHRTAHRPRARRDGRAPERSGGRDTGRGRRPAAGEGRPGVALRQGHRGRQLSRPRLRGAPALTGRRPPHTVPVRGRLCDLECAA